MSLDKIYNYLTKNITDSHKDDFVDGIIVGIIIGIGIGIGIGISAGISAGIIAGIIVGIIAVFIAVIGIGLGAGIGIGIGAGIGAGIVDYILSTPTYNELTIIGIIILILAEVLFLKLDSKTPEPHQSKIQFTLKRKLIALLESIIIIGSTIGMYRSINIVSPYVSSWFKNNGLTGLDFIGWGSTILLIFYGYIWLNSLKYRLKEKKERKGED